MSTVTAHRPIASPLTAKVTPTVPAGPVPAGQQEYRLEIVTDPDPDYPAAIVWYRASGIAAALSQARRLLAAHDGPDDQYGELYQRNGELADYLTTLHQGA
ncbi:hypothetical protein EV385_6622 [Krasilnikovia cinnamomea]|uniref:Uncharacterized protein n=1 Tax=Krasilnikovia cinnamomea TaxID=349313 RepID=A0A4Q7Z7Y3_9ACTN|nr:hypothetical protein [Krasilnikovia cinnamomea]RZU46548.1 hypothetical protein EV385_6622 [Krasilnikovia cinnamomea]